MLITIKGSQMECVKKSWVAAFLLIGLFYFSSAAENDPGLNVYYGEIPEGDRILFVAPDGDNENEGTEEHPWATLDYAVSQVQQGDVIVLRGGVYFHDDIIRINTPQGTEQQRIVVTAYPGEIPILDFSIQPKERDYHGIRLNANYWHLIGITIRNASHNGIRMDGAFNILEQLTAYGNHDTGIHLAGGALGNLIKNCDSFHNFNYDPARTPRIGNNADGFGAKFLIGPGNVFHGCRAWENSDDGFDFWEAANTIVVENCWAFGNGDASVFDNPDNFEGNGNGFKLGGNNVRGDHIVKRSVAFENFGASGNAKGFDFNNNPGAMTLIHNTAFNNGRNFVFPLQPSDTPSVFLNNLSALPANFHTQITPDALQAGNSWQHEMEVTEDMFLSVDTELAKGPRQQDGSLPEIELFRPAPESFVVDGGVAIAEPFYGSAPDMGAYEYVTGEPVDPWIARGEGDFIGDLVIYDMENAQNWEILDAFEPGMEAFGDRDYTISSVPGLLIIDEWLRPSMESRTKSYLEIQAEFELLQERHIFIAHSDRVTNKPAWLSDYKQTDMKITIRESEEVERELTIYSREANAGETITLGKNSIDGTTGSLMYLAMVGTIDPVTVDASTELPEEFVLLQNYPNPFNPSTTIEYKVPHRTQVTITVYDVMGRQIAELVNGDHEPGMYSFVWNARSLPSGVYYYRIAAGEYSDVKNLMLLK
jgi:hypothetical protein